MFPTLFVAEIKENTGNVDTHANHCTDIKRIEFLMGYLSGRNCWKVISFFPMVTGAWDRQR